MRQNDSNYYKIGVSNNPLSRVGDISNGNPFGVELLMYGVILNPYDREKQLHEYFSNERIRPNGEWFELCRMDLKTLEATLEAWVKEDLELASKGNAKTGIGVPVFRKAPDLRRIKYTTLKREPQNVEDYI